MREKFAKGQQRAAVRMSKASESLSKTSPKIEEVDVIHKLYLASKEVKMQKEAIINAYLWTPMAGLKPGDEEDVRTKNGHQGEKKKKK